MMPLDDISVNTIFSNMLGTAFVTIDSSAAKADITQVLVPRKRIY